jgi:hypothetical protein
LNDPPSDAPGIPCDLKKFFVEDSSGAFTGSGGFTIAVGRVGGVGVSVVLFLGNSGVDALVSGVGVGVGAFTSLFGSVEGEVFGASPAYAGVTGAISLLILSVSVDSCT